MFFDKQVSPASDTDPDNLHDPSDNPHDLSFRPFDFPPLEVTSRHMNCIKGRSVMRKFGVCLVIMIMIVMMMDWWWLW